MKKILFTLIAISSYLVMNAQEEGIQFGVKAGLNVSNLYGSGDYLYDEDETVDYKLGYHVGALVEIPIFKTFAIQPEVLFSTQGAKSESEETDDGIDYFTDSNDIDLSYLNIPIMVKFYPVKGLSIQAGPQFGYLIDAERLENYDNEEEETDIKDSLKSEDVSLNFGLGYQSDLGLFLDARYNLGLTESTYEGGDFKNGVFQISVGYKF